LLDNQVPEGKSLEYKQTLPAASDSDRKEFLADASSFANAAGGHLIYGIAESSGVPTELCGLDIGDPDAEIRRLESMIQDGIAPRIPSISTRAIPLASSRIVIIIQIPRSFASPHMVTFKGHSR
jgi:predicted HTH transcriptional regulator